MSRQIQAIAVFLVTITAAYGLITGKMPILTPDRQGYRLFKQQNYHDAVEHFGDPMWKGASLFKDGSFEQAAGVYAGYDTAESSFNQGTCLIMMGKYEDAIPRLERSIALNPGWQQAENNLAIARARAELTKKEGGNMTGGKMGADDIVFTEGKSPSNAGEEEISEMQELSDAEMRAVWLRNVQTKPADFLRAKFAYQQTVTSAPLTSKNKEEPAD